MIGTPHGTIFIALRSVPVSDLASQTARSSVRLVKQALSDLRAASADLSNDANIQEVTRSADVLSSAIKRLASYIGDAPNEDEAPRQRVSIDIRRVNRIIRAAMNDEKCPICGLLRP